MVKIEISKRESTIFVFFAFIFLTIGLVWAYGDFSGNDGTINGHSSDELMVKLSENNFISLQSLIDGQVAEVGNCGWYVTGDSDYLDFYHTPSVTQYTSAIYSIRPECAEVSTSIRGPSLSDQSPYVICPSDKPYLMGMAFLDNVGGSSTEVDGGEIVARCCQ
jgi:hypothetical protein